MPAAFFRFGSHPQRFFLADERVDSLIDIDEILNFAIRHFFSTSFAEKPCF